MGRIGRVWSGDRRLVAAVALSLSGLGVGFAYLRRWKLFVGYLVCLLAWFLLASSTGFWLAVLIVLVVGSIVLTVVAARDATRREAAAAVRAVARPVEVRWVVGADGALSQLAFPAGAPPAAGNADRRGRPIAGLVLGLVLLAVVVGVTAGYRNGASAALGRGDDAHAAGNCARALERYDEVTAFYRRSFTTAIDQAKAHRAACERLLAARGSAEAAASGSSWNGAIGDYQAYLDLGGRALFADGAADELATVRTDYAASLVADDTVESYGAAYEQYRLVATELPGSDAAAAVPDDLAALHAAVLEARQGCEQVQVLATFADLAGDEVAQPLVALVGGSLPTAIVGCGQEHFDGGEADKAQASWQRVLDDYPGSSAVGNARRKLSGLPAAMVARGRDQLAAGKLDDAEASARWVVGGHPGSVMAGPARQLLADVATARIRAEIDDLATGAAELPAPTPAGSAPGGSVTLKVTNGSNVGLEVLYDGPTTGSVTLPACGDCPSHSFTVLPGTTCATASSPSRTLTLPAGSYRMVVKATEGGVTPYSGTFNLTSGTAYDDCYYIVTTTTFG